MELSSLVRLGGSSFRCSYYCTLFHAFSTHSSHYHPCQNHFKMSSSVYQNIYFPAEGIGSSYPENLRFLYGINDKLKKDGILAPSDSSLTNTLRLYDLIGRPLDRIPTVHVGGTNGKGSTSLKIAESLHACGLRTGLFVSPHLASFRERMQIDGKLMPEDAFMLHLPTVLQLCGNHGIPATLFELTFILACLYYEHTNCQVVVLEVGLGGELDATNVVQTALSIICSVSLDHTRILGATVEEIGLKKAGIFKQNVPALVGPGCPMDVMHSVASSRGALLTTLEEATVKYGRWSVSEQGLGHGENGDNNIVAATTTTAAAVDDDYEDTDVLNSRIAHAALSILRETQVALGNDVFAAIDVWSTQVHHALSTRPPCRWEIHNVLVDATPTHSTSGSISGESMGGSMMGERVQVPVTVVLDVGHNPAAVAALSRRIRKQFTGRYHPLNDTHTRTHAHIPVELLLNSPVHSFFHYFFTHLITRYLSLTLSQSPHQSPINHPINPLSHTLFHSSYQSPQDTMCACYMPCPVTKT